MKTINAEKLLSGLQFSSQLLFENQNTLNELNFFPVADKDTGTNMAVSFQKTIIEALSASHSSPKDLMESVYFGMLNNGHGNSGTILTMFFEGFYYALPDASVITASDLAKAFAAGSDRAQCGVSNPIDGTILSVAKAAAEAGLSVAEISDDSSLIWHRITSEAHIALSFTAVRNPVLKKYKVIDSGAFGFCLILDGIHKVLCPTEKLPEYQMQFFRPDLTENETDSSKKELRYPFCTEFVMKMHSSADINAFEQKIRPLGDCFLMIKKDQIIKIHIHTEIPDKILSEAEKKRRIAIKKNR